MRTTNLCLLFAALVGTPIAVQDAVQDPYAKPDDSWISISGTVDSVAADAFLLDYGKGNVLVEMDDGDRDADGYKLVKGDKVTVSGVIDDDLYENTKIEAASVYVENLGTYFYASAVDEEDVFVTMVTPVVISRTYVQGTVTAVDAEAEKFMVDTGIRKLTVEVDAMPYNPLDDVGYQKIRKGDRVSISGDMDYDFFEGRVFEADWVTTLKKKRDKKDATSQATDASGKKGDASSKKGDADGND